MFGWRVFSHPAKSISPQWIRGSRPVAFRDTDPVLEIWHWDSVLQQWFALSNDQTMAPAVRLTPAC